MKKILVILLVILTAGCDDIAMARSSGHSHRYPRSSARLHYGKSIRTPKAWNGYGIH